MGAGPADVADATQSSHSTNRIKRSSKQEGTQKIKSRVSARKMGGSLTLSRSRMFVRWDMQPREGTPTWSFNAGEL